MSLTFVVVDDLLHLDDLKIIQDQVKLTNVKYSWFDLIDQHEYFNLCHLFLHNAHFYYDLTNIVGYEFWGHSNTRPPSGWHYDKDEIEFQKNKIYKFPVCSIVYYPIIDNLTGGELVLEKDTILPKQNRLVVFGPGIHHYVNEFEGTRYSIVINPWIYKIESNT